MIQSGKFDSLVMNIKKIANYTSNFIIRRIIEFFGIIILILLGMGKEIQLFLQIY